MYFYIHLCVHACLEWRYFLWKLGMFVYSLFCLIHRNPSNRLTHFMNSTFLPCTATFQLSTSPPPMSLWVRPFHSFKKVIFSFHRHHRLYFNWYYSATFHSHKLRLCMPFYNNEYNGIRQSFFIRFCYQTPQQQAPSHHNHQQHQPPNLRSATRMRENDAFSTVSIHLINITRLFHYYYLSDTITTHQSVCEGERIEHLWSA